MLADTYAAAFPKSRERFAAAQQLFPCGVTHDTRMMDPFPVYVDRARGSHKWAIDGQELIDYFVGHGSLLLGHSPPDVVAAVQEQMAKGTHYGSCHDLEIRWGELVRRLVPSAERVRFTGSGTEATLMALRLARPPGAWSIAESAMLGVVGPAPLTTCSMRLSMSRSCALSTLWMLRE